MTAPELSLGTLFEVASSPYRHRVIACDDREIMFDTWWAHKDAWSMASLRGDFTYLRLPRQCADANATRLGTEPLTEAEFRVHRPDLPFAVACRTDVSWYDSSWEPGVFGTSVVLPAATIYLSPFGPRDNIKPSVLLTADDGLAFTERELLTKARALQASLIGTVRLTEGVGIYRSGIRKRIASYYIWGARSRAEAPATVSAHAAKRI